MCVCGGALWQQYELHLLVLEFAIFFPSSPCYQFLLLFLNKHLWSVQANKQEVDGPRLLLFTQLTHIDSCSDCYLYVTKQCLWWRMLCKQTRTSCPCLSLLSVCLLSTYLLSEAAFPLGAPRMCRDAPSAPCVCSADVPAASSRLMHVFFLKGVSCVHAVASLMWSYWTGRSGLNNVLIVFSCVQNPNSPWSTMFVYLRITSVCWCHVVLTILAHLFTLLTRVHHFCFVCSPPPQHPSVFFFLDQLCAFSSCDFVMWLLHGADDVVFAGQQKVTFLFLFFSWCDKQKSLSDLII